jgi:hypothetical protein
MLLTVPAVETVTFTVDVELPPTLTDPVFVCANRDVVAIGKPVDARKIRDRKNVLMGGPPRRAPARESETAAEQ